MKVRAIVAAIGITWLLLLTACGKPDPTNTALPRAFVKVSAQLETGVSYRDYSPLIAEANTELKLYSESAEGKAHPNAVRRFKDAMELYIEARTVWARKFDRSFGLDGAICAGGIYDRDYGARYPDIPTNEPRCQRGGYQVDDLLRRIWREAGKLSEDGARLMTK